ncbi:MAG TPA: RagB/SusD family nutrient uptake outer membrane protein [Puia sp.]|uniref:RagB/SusD family nutrient uptake outer membrane protein n=1 Tax=Puia sp. TaxID=2045100 RepID=UPI002C272751|nr:RagB/SusD family nutrient uptake outer membrane protein [Puia sp.]HVU94331.1 RagB/SusD family nutrient uptake outer membrane protein [Puia sp.]
MQYNYKLPAILLLLSILGLSACRKLVSVPEPINTLTTAEVFSTDAEASSAMAGIYTTMINPLGYYPTGFANGEVTISGGLSSDDLVYANSGTLVRVNTNHLLPTDGSGAWDAYNEIYGANAVIGGIAASTSPLLHDSVRKELTGEAKFVRALCYFYLTNFNGDVPLALTIDFNQTRNLPRAPQADVYRQIIQDLKDAQAALPADYSVGGGERIRPNKWAATALLARVYLYTGDNADAFTQASAVIANTGQYSLVSDLNGVFLANSTEAIWQLQQNTSHADLGTATSEGFLILPNPLNTGFSTFNLSPQLLAAFEPGDLRRSAWVDSTNNSQNVPLGRPSVTTYFPFKYKTGSYNYSIGGTASEYYMVLRLAEQYLIRAEAEANGAGGGTAAAIADLNVIRQRAGLPALPSALTPAQVTAAVAHERQVELFAEWGHRWLDLKRTGQAHAVLSVIPLKQPWAGDYQLLYPISITEIQADPNLTQNPGYN